MQEEEEPREERRGVTVKEIRQRTTKIFVQAPTVIFFFSSRLCRSAAAGQTKKRDYKDSWPATETALGGSRNSALA